MREALLILLVVGLGVAGLAKARVALLTYIWFAVMRPDVLAWATDRPYSFVLGVIAVLSCLRELPYAPLVARSRWMILFLALMGWIALSAVVSDQFDDSMLMLRIFLPTLLTAALIPVVLRTFEDLRQLYLVMAFSLGFLGLKFGLWAVIHGGARLTGGYGGSLTDNNLFALAVVVGLPLCWYARLATQDWRLKLMYVGFSAFIIPAVIMTHSRGGALALAVALGFIAWHSKRRAATLVILALVAVPSLLLVKDSFLDRMRTMADYESDLSSKNRITYWKGAFRLSLDNPVTGVGFGGLAYVKKIPKYLGADDAAQYAHNNYLQMAADSGYPALILFCILLFGQFFWYRAAGMKFKDRDPVMYAMALGMAGALAGFAVGSVFLSRTYWETIYYLLAMGSAFSPVMAARLRELKAAPAPAAEAAPMPEPPAAPPPPPAPEPPRFKLGGRERRRPAAGVAAGAEPPRRP